MSRSDKKDHKRKSKKTDNACCLAQFACNFSGVSAVLNPSVPQLTVGGLNGINGLISSCNCKSNLKSCDIGTCNKIQVNSVTAGGILIPITTIVQNSNGLFIAILGSQPTEGSSFTVTLTNQAVGCTGTVMGTVTAM